MAMQVSTKQVKHNYQFHKCRQIAANNFMIYIITLLHSTVQYKPVLINVDPPVSS